MNKLYDIVFKTQENRKLLYFKGNADITEQGLYITAGDVVDFLTYFNSFSISKWKEYTNIKKLQINGNIVGYAEIEINTIGKNGKLLIKQQVSGAFSVCLNVENISGEILGIKVKANNNTIIQKITYLGEFTEWKQQKIGVIICTYKREKYVKATIDKLVKFSKKNIWLTTLVVDNGSTLKECKNDYLRIIHNPNYGGSGGFTRGIIENLKNKTNDYVLLMDDDIDLDTTVLERTHSLVSALKDEYRESFVAGAMLNIDEPYIQYEDTAYWNKFRPSSLGRNYDLSSIKVLIKNENLIEKENKYAGWWYCCIPMKIVRKIGLPLPVFIKGDDIEYSIRNDSKIITINGIGVWHELFSNKRNGFINYLADRNMLMINNYIKKSNYFYFVTGLILRIVRRLLEFNKNSLYFLYFALSDYRKGLPYITQQRPDSYMEKLKQNTDKYKQCYLLLKIFIEFLIIFVTYKSTKKQYLNFRKNELFGTKFWCKYLNES